MEKKDLARHLNPRALELYVLPTENCNFRCTYCYEDFEIGKMTEQTVQAVKNLIGLRLKNLDKLQISWFGGEPTMAKEIVLDVARFAQQESERLGVRYKGSMTTNAYALIPDLFSQFVQAGINHYQISLDGSESEHNQTRILVSGKGTFERIWKNLLAMREQSSKFTILLRVHIHQDNVDSVRTLLSKICQEFNDDVRFEIMMKAVWNSGLEKIKSLNLFKTPKQILEELEQQLFDSGWFENRPGQYKRGKSLSPCYASKPNSLVLRANGKVAKCTVAFNDARNDVGTLNPDGSVTLNKDLMRAFMAGFETLDEKKLSCPVWSIPKSLAEPKPQVVQFVRKEEMIPA